MQATTDYLIQTFWNLVQWGKTDGPTTAEVLSRACDTHVVKKEEDLRHVRQREDGQRKVLNEARHATEEAQASLNAENRSLDACIDGLKERFRFLRDAINVALESSADDEEPTETLRQLCVVAEEFSAKDFQGAVTTIEGRIDGARRHHRSVRQREEGAKARLEEIEAERRAIESHIDEIKRIKVQLDERFGAEGPSEAAHRRGRDRHGGGRPTPAPHCAPHGQGPGLAGGLLARLRSALTQRKQDYRLVLFG